jgi:Tol biopolymer transport system component
VEPAWSPNGGTIAYLGNVRPNLLGSLFVLDLTSGVSTKISDEAAFGPAFTPDGTSLLYTASGPEYPLELRTVPLTGGESKALFGADAGIDDSGNGSISPDGSLVTFLGSGTPPTDEASHCGPCRFVSNIDGSNRQVISGWMANPAGTWSPDGSRIVSMEIMGGFDTEGPGFELEQPELKGLGGFYTEVIVVVDVATEEPTIVAYGRSAIWVDDHTILVEV